MIDDYIQPHLLDRVVVIIPVLNEERSIGLVLKDLPKVRQVFVVDNGSADGSGSVAAAAGADVTLESQRGYGRACLTGIIRMQEFLELEAVDTNETIVVFIDGDYSDHPDELPKLVAPIASGEFDFVVGSRSTGEREHGAMHPQAVFGNWLACRLMKLFWNARFTDLGPFRAIRLGALNTLQMRDENFGWTIEMQIKAVQNGLRCTEVPVAYRRRVGVSKISGTVVGTVKAGCKILYTIFRHRFLA